MWGGLKSRAAYGEIFRRWSATKPLEEVRHGLFKEPRPWHLLFSLHEHKHFLSDHHCSRVLSWCATTIQLGRTVEEKRNAYRLTQESFNVLLHSHGVANLSFLEYMRICAVGRDLSAAYRLYQYWLESNRPEAGSVLYLAWLAQLALLTPSVEKAEDMGLAVMQQYQQRYNFQVGFSLPTLGSGENTSDHLKHTKILFACLKALQSRVQNPVLLEFLDKLPLSEKDALAHLNGWGYPHQAHHHTFAHFEGGITAPVASVNFPALRDSLLHPVLIQQLQSAAFHEKNVEKVIALMQYFQQRIKKEKALRDTSGTMRASSREPDIWRQLHDASAVQFRKKIIDAGGLTPELYHYVIVALASTKPSAALRTVQRMEAANLRVLDLTRAVLIAATSGSLTDQLKLFSAQMKEIAFREQLDLDHQTNTHLEAFWKFEYTTFFHYQNALDKKSFFLFLMKAMGPVAVQRLCLLHLRQEEENVLGRTDSVKSQENATKAEEEDEYKWTEIDFVITEPSFREAVVEYMDYQYGDSNVQKCLDDITHSIPKLDISLVGSLPHFESYALPQVPGEDIATDMFSLRRKLSSFSCVYVVDASFVEASEEGIFHLGQRCGSITRYGEETHRSEGTSGRSLILFPFRVLQQMANTITESSAPSSVSLDPALQEDIQEEIALASQRLRSVFSMIHHSHSVAVQADEKRAHDALSASNERDENDEDSRVILGKEGTTATTTNITMNSREQEQKNVSFPLEEMHHTRKKDEHCFPTTPVCARILHFSECLLSQSVELDTLKSTFDLRPDQVENDRLLLLLSLIRTAAPMHCRVVLCSDDVELNIKLEDLAQTHTPEVLQRLFPSGVELLSTPIPEHVISEEKDVLVDDNPILDIDPENFEPVLRAPPAPANTAFQPGGEATSASAEPTSTSDVAGGSPLSSSPVKDDDSTFSDSPWLSLLEEGEASMVSQELCNDGSETPVQGENVYCGAETTETRGASDMTGGSPSIATSQHRRRDEITPAAAVAPSATATTPMVLGDDETAEIEDALFSTYATPHDVTPIAADVLAASTVKSVFHEFDVLEPEEEMEREAARAARRSALSPGNITDGAGTPAARSFSVLMKDTLSNRGYSRRLRARMARRLSNQSGGRVPFNLRYQVVEANVHDPRNRHLLDIYRKGVERKREEFHRKWQ